MYLSYVPQTRSGLGEPARSRDRTPRCSTTCADEAITERTALLYSDRAPLGGKPECDYRAVWTFVPNGATPPLSTLVYFHGVNSVVTASRAAPNGRPACWSGGRMNAPLRPNGPRTPGLKYELDRAAQAASQKPLVLVPEIAQPGRTFWGSPVEGAFTSDTGRLGAMVQDSLSRLGRLTSPAGNRYVPAAWGLQDVRRLFLAGHSGGERPLHAACRNGMARSVPTDLWLLDCTYSGGFNADYLNWVRHWRTRLGNQRGMARMVIVTTASQTRPNTESLISAMRGLGLTAARFSGGRLRAWRGRGPASGAQIVEVTRDATPDQVRNVLRQTPIIHLHSRFVHDELPRGYAPWLLETAAGA